MVLAKMSYANESRRKSFFREQIPPSAGRGYRGGRGQMNGSTKTKMQRTPPGALRDGKASEKQTPFYFLVYRPQSGVTSPLTACNISKWSPGSAIPFVGVYWHA